MGEHCRNWIGEERCGKPAEFIVWGKLFPLDALGPRCYDCAAEQVGHRGLAVGNPQGYAIYHLNDVDNAMAQRDRLLSAAKQWKNATESRVAEYPCICVEPGWGYDSKDPPSARPCLRGSPEYRPEYHEAEALLKADRDLIQAIEEVGGE